MTDCIYAFCASSLLFFFSSRRRHTRSLCDWSSDVCSSDLSVVGPSGCGKTTLLWAMSGLHALTRGEILLSGQPVAGPRPAEIGMIFQEANLLPWRNLRQNIEFPFEIKKHPVAPDRLERL